MTPLGRLVDARMRERGLTIGGAADACHITWGAMRNVVEGRTSEPRPKTMEGLRRGLGITDDDLRACGYPIPDGTPVPPSELPTALAAKAARAGVPAPAPLEGQQTLSLDGGAAVVDLQGWRDWGVEAVLVAGLEHVRSGDAGPSQAWGPEIANRLLRMANLADQAEALVRY